MSLFSRAPRWGRLRFEERAWSGYYFGRPALLLLAAGAVTGGFHYGAGPLENKLAAKGDYLLAEFEADRGHNTEASNLVRAALLHARTDASIWRLAAILSERLNSTDAAYCWRQVDLLAPGDLPTQLACADAATRARQFDLAAAVLDEVPEPEHLKSTFLCAAASLAQARGETAQAAQYFDLLNAQHPTEGRCRLALAEWRATSSDPAILRQSQTELSLLLGMPKYRAGVLRALIAASTSLGERQKARAWSDQLLQSREATWADQIRRLDLEDGSLQKRALADLTKVANAEKIPSLIQWMVAHAGAEQALIWIREEPETIQNDPRVGAARAECLTALGLWGHLRGVQQADSWPQHESSRLMYLTRALVHLGEMKGAQAAWTRSVFSCHSYGDFLELLDGADAAAKIPSADAFWADAKTQVLQQMAAVYPDQEWIARALLQDAFRHHDSLRAKENWARLAELNANDVEAAAQWRLLSLLRHEQMGQSSAALTALRRDHPGDDHVLAAVAYDFFRQGRRPEAMEALGELAPARLRAAENAALFAPILAAEGMLDESRGQIAVALGRPDLMPEEHGLVDEARTIITYQAEMKDVFNARAGGSYSPVAPIENVGSNHKSTLSAVAQSVRCSRAGLEDLALEALAQIDVTKLESVEQSVYLGGVLYLAGDVEAARPCLDMDPDLPYQTNLALFQRAAKGWWKICAHTENRSTALRGLFAVYEELEKSGASPEFWNKDEAQEITLLRSILLRGQDIEGARLRLESLLRHVPFTPESQALRAFALARSGQPLAAERCLEESLSSRDLRRPEPALIYGMVLASAGRKAEALPYLKMALASVLSPEEKALAIQTANTP